MRLTEQVVDEAELPERGRIHLWDDDLPGFGLRVYPSGSRSFVYRYAVPGEGRDRTMVLGSVGELTVDQARQEADRIRRRVRDGADPAGTADPARAGFTFDEYAEMYLRRMGERWADRTRREYERRVRNHLGPVLGSVRLESVTRAQVAALLERMAESSGPYETNRTHDLVRAMFNRAASWGFFPRNRPNPAHGIERFEETSRTRWLRPGEVEALLEAVAAHDDPHFRAFVPLVLLTGLRKNELLGIRWDKVDLGRGEILLPDRTRGRRDVRKISRPAREILSQLPRQDDNPFVFPGRREGTHRRDFRNEWRAVREEVGLDDVTLHDLRRTAGAFMARAGVSLRTIGEVLGHQSAAVTRVYEELADEREREREAMERLGGELTGFVGDRPSPPV